MKVRELMAHLARFDPEAKIVFPCDDFPEMVSVRFVGQNPEDRAEIVLDESGSRWECNFPQPLRVYSESEIKLQAITSQALKIMSERFAFALSEPNYLLDHLKMIGEETDQDPDEGEE